MSGFSGTKNAVVTVVNVAKEVGGNLELIAERLYSASLVSAADLLSSILSIFTDVWDSTNHLLKTSILPSSTWDVNSTVINAVTMGGDINVTVDLTTVAPGREVVGLQLDAASADHIGTINLTRSNNNVTFHAIPIQNLVTGVVSNGTVSVTAGVALASFVSLSDLGARYLKINYTRSSGTGALTANICVR